MNPNLCDLQLPPCQGDLSGTSLRLIDADYHDASGQEHHGQILCCQQCAERLAYEDAFIANSILELTCV